jgi:acetyl-CoA acyltransferase
MYHGLRSDELAVQTLKALLQRVPLDPAQIDDFFLGCVGQHLEQGKNLARLILLLAGLPDTIPGVTINRLCASSLTALQMAADSIRAEANKLTLVGGVEHLGHVPMTAAVDYNPALFARAEFQWTNMGLTAEKLADRYGITRAEQDEFAVESNGRYFSALDQKRLAREIVPIELPDGTTVARDEEPRQSTKETLAGLRTPFKENGTVTAGNSSGVSDGACMAIVGDQETVDRLRVKPLAKIGACVTVGLDPTVMGLGPVYAIPKLLEKTGLTIGDIDLFEINEAFAVQALTCQRALNIPSSRLNIRGGAVALGHPLGMSGLRIAVSLAHSLAAQSGRYGIASMCVGHGQGVAMLVERT